MYVSMLYTHMYIYTHTHTDLQRLPRTARFKLLSRPILEPCSPEELRQVQGLGFRASRLPRSEVPSPSAAT